MRSTTGRDRRSHEARRRSSSRASLTSSPKRSVARFVERTRHPVVDRRRRDDLLVALQRTVLVEPEHVGMNEREASIERCSQHESCCSIDRPGRHQVTLEVAAVQQRRRTRVSDVVQRGDGVDAAVRLRHNQQARAVEQQLVAAIGNVELRHHLRTGNVDDPHTVLRCDEHVRAVGLDDVTLVDSDLLRVRSRVVRRDGRGRSCERPCRRSPHRQRWPPSSAPVRRGSTCPNPARPGPTRSPAWSPRPACRRGGRDTRRRIAASSEPSALNFAGPCDGVLVGVVGSVVVVSGTSVVVGAVTVGTVGAALGLSPVQPATVNVAIATTKDAIGSVRVMRI